MTNEPKKLKLDLSSIVSLKAELFNKQEEFKQKKQSIVEIKDVYETNKTQSKWGKKKEVKVQPSTSKDSEKNEENEDKLLEKSRKMLESKAKYYEEVVTGKKITDEGDEEIFLVNFDQKVVEQKNEEPDSENLKLKQNLNEEEYNKILKKRWEKESIQNLDKDTVHYQDIRFNEIRNMGVGNYQFSRDEQERKTQMEFFKNIEKESKTRRILNEIHKLKREKILVQRLSKVKQKRLLNFGYSLEKIKELCTEFETENEQIDKEIADLEILLENPDLMGQKNESNEDLDKIEFNKPNIQRPILEREWDKPKLKEKIWTRHVEKLRKERIKMFAPPESYEQTKKTKKKKKKNKNQERRDNEDENEKAHTESTFSFNIPFPPPPMPHSGVFFPPFPPFPPMVFPFPPPPPPAV